MCIWTRFLHTVHPLAPQPQQQQSRKASLRTFLRRRRTTDTSIQTFAVRPIPTSKRPIYRDLHRSDNISPGTSKILPDASNPPNGFNPSNPPWCTPTVHTNGTDAQSLSSTLSEYMLDPKSTQVLSQNTFQPPPDPMLSVVARPGSVVSSSTQRTFGSQRNTRNASTNNDVSETSEHMREAKLNTGRIETQNDMIPKYQLTTAPWPI